MQITKWMNEIKERSNGLPLTTIHTTRDSVVVSISTIVYQKTTKIKITLSLPPPPKFFLKNFVISTYLYYSYVIRLNITVLNVMILSLQKKGS